MPYEQAKYTVKINVHTASTHNNEGGIQWNVEGEKRKLLYVGDYTAKETMSSSWSNNTTHCIDVYKRQLLYHTKAP